MTHKVTKPIALDESFRTTEQNPQNIADVLANKLDAIKSAIENGGSDEMEAAFECHYNVTSATDIYNAMQEKKVPFFYQNGVVAQLWKVETNKYTFRTTSTRVVEGENILDIVDYIVNGSVWSTATKTISGGSSSQQVYLAKVESSVNFDTTGLSGMQSIISVNDVPADGVYQLSIFMCITPKTASATKSDLVFQFTGTSGTGMPNTTFHAVVDDSQTFAQQLSFSTTLNLKAGTNTLKMACGGLNTEYLVFVDNLTVAQLVNGVYHNGDNFNEVHTLTQASNFNNDDGVLVDGATGGPRFMLWQTLANKVLGFIKSLSTTITAFRTGDVIPVDGPSGTAKMSKDDLLKETAENAVDSGVAAAAPTTGISKIIPYSVTNGEYIHKTDGTFVSSGNAKRTNLIDLSGYSTSLIAVTSISGYSSCMCALYDDNEDFIVSLGKGTAAPYPVWNNEVLEIAQLLTDYPTARYIAFSAWPTLNEQGYIGFKAGEFFKDSFTFSRNLSPQFDDGKDYSKNDVVIKDDVLYKFVADHSAGTWDASEVKEVNVDGTYEKKPDSGKVVSLGIAYTSGEYVDKADGSFVSSSYAMRTDLIALSTLEGKTLSISAGAGYNTCIYAVYGENREFINSYGKVPTSPYLDWDGELVEVSDILANDPTARYIAFSSWPTNYTRNLSVGEFVRNTIDSIYDELKAEDAEIRAIAVNANPTTGTITDLGLNFYDEYVEKSDGDFVPYGNAHRTDYLDLNDYTGKTFCVSGTAGYSTCIYAVYDENKTFLNSYGKGTAIPYLVYDLQKIKVSDILANDPTARYVVFSSWPTTTKDLFVGEWTADTTDSAIVKVKTDNLLYGKKWVACGDSFTNGGNMGDAGYDPVMQMYKSYPWWIAQRTGCNVVNMAKSGERIHNDPNSTNKFTPDRYKTIPTDADIITISYGLNEINVDIGDSTSSDNTNLWGAFNEVLGWIMTNIPKAKVGIIISDGWMPTRIADAEKAIAEYWCVPVLDMKYDPQVPLGIASNAGGVPQVRPNTSSLAQSARNSVFADATYHPNLDGHEYRSTFIETWLKTL